MSRSQTDCLNGGPSGGATPVQVPERGSENQTQMFFIETEHPVHSRMCKANGDGVLREQQLVGGRDWHVVCKAETDW